MAVMVAMTAMGGVVVPAGKIVPGLSIGLTTMPRPLIATRGMQLG